VTRRPLTPPRTPRSPHSTPNTQSVKEFLSNIITDSASLLKIDIYIFDFHDYPGLPENRSGWKNQTRHPRTGRRPLSNAHDLDLDLDLVSKIYGFKVATLTSIISGTPRATETKICRILGNMALNLSFEGQGHPRSNDRVIGVPAELGISICAKFTK
jgi:hypothetical protein